MKKFAVLFLILYFLGIMFFALQPTVKGFQDMINQLRHNPADMYMTYTTDITYK
jgi:hypothetical protein